MEEMLDDMIAEFGLKGLPNRELLFDWNIKPTQDVYIIVFVEAWTTREHWMVHNDAPTVKAIKQGVEGKLLKPFVVQELYAAN
jgi:quinol monooxygenase YgiN